MIYAVNYDLKEPGRDYSGLHAAIKNCGDWWHYLGSTWLIDTRVDATAVWTSLSPHIDKSDRLLVIGVTNENAGWLPQEAWNWLNSRHFARHNS